MDSWNGNAELLERSFFISILFIITIYRRNHGTIHFYFLSRIWLLLLLPPSFDCNPIHTFLQCSHHQTLFYVAYQGQNKRDMVHRRWCHSDVYGREEALFGRAANILKIWSRFTIFHSVHPSPIKESGGKTRGEHMFPSQQQQPSDQLKYVREMRNCYANIINLGIRVIVITLRQGHKQWTQLGMPLPPHQFFHCFLNVSWITFYEVKWRKTFHWYTNYVFYNIWMFGIQGWG